MSDSSAYNSSQKYSISIDLIFRVYLF